jgi:hypothetical protein
MEAILGQKKQLSSTFCAMHNRDKLSIKQRVICRVRKRFQAPSHMVRKRGRKAWRTIIARK